MKNTALIVCVLGVACPAAAAQVTENFTSAASTSNGATLGQCSQLTVGLAGSGTLTVSGNGTAAISTPAVGDAAILYSSQPLPATYKVSVEVQNVAYPKGSVENGVTVLAITNNLPSPGTEVDWSTHRLVAVEIDSKPDFVNDSSAFVNYWDSAYTLYTWDGSQWGAGDNGWNPYFPPQTSYEVTVEKTATDYVITVSSGGASVTSATVPVSNVAPASSEYLVVGDRITDFFAGSMNVVRVTMPASCGGSDAGPDGSVPEFPTPEAGTGYYDGWPTGGDGYLPSKPRPTEPSACDCNVGARPRAPLGALLLLAFLLLARRRAA